MPTIPYAAIYNEHGMLETLRIIRVSEDDYADNAPVSSFVTYHDIDIVKNFSFLYYSIETNRAARAQLPIHALSYPWDIKDLLPDTNDFKLALNVKDNKLIFGGCAFCITRFIRKSNNELDLLTEPFENYAFIQDADRNGNPSIILVIHSDGTTELKYDMDPHCLQPLIDNVTRFIPLVVPRAEEQHCLSDMVATGWKAEPTKTGIKIITGTPVDNSSDKSQLVLIPKSAPMLNLNANNIAFMGDINLPAHLTVHEASHIVFPYNVNAPVVLRMLHTPSLSGRYKPDITFPDNANSLSFYLQSYGYNKFDKFYWDISGAAAKAITLRDMGSDSFVAYDPIISDVLNIECIGDIVLGEFDAPFNYSTKNLYVSIRDASAVEMPFHAENVSITGILKTNELEIINSADTHIHNLIIMLRLIPDDKYAIQHISLRDIDADNVYFYIDTKPVLPELVESILFSIPLGNRHRDFSVGADSCNINNINIISAKDTDYKSFRNRNSVINHINAFKDTDPNAQRFLEQGIPIAQAPDKSESSTPSISLDCTANSCSYIEDFFTADVNDPDIDLFDDIDDFEDDDSPDLYD